MAIQLSAKEEISASEIAEICSCSRSKNFIWHKAFRLVGFEELLERKKSAPIKRERRGISAQASRELD